MGCIVLDDVWKDVVLGLLATEGPEPDNALEIRRIDVALANLRKQHLWGAVTDQEFKDGFRDLQRQRQSMTPRLAGRTAPNLEQAAKILQDLPALWQHPGITAEQRRELARVVFEEIRLRDGCLTAVRPQPQYVPLFAYVLWSADVGDERSPRACRRAVGRTAGGSTGSPRTGW